MTETTKLAHCLESKVRTKDVILEENVSFKSLLLPENILQGLLEAGFQKPSPIQIRAVPVGRCGFDLTVKSKSGTGKTLVFGIIALETIKLQRNEPQALILVPTREIAVQIEDVLKSIGKYLDGLNVQSFIGGLPLSTDKVKCCSCHIAVGTPGRVKQLIQEGHLAANAVKLFVLDEADKLMENSFQNDITDIFNRLPDRKQVIMCSATYPNELESFLNNYMLSPTFVSAELETPLLLGLKHFVKILTSSPNIVQQTKVKNEELLKVVSIVSFNQCLIFSNYQTRAESVSNFLNRNGFNSTFISGAQSQTERLSSLSSLKEFKCKILISTDLTSRGIDAANVDLVINYDIPGDAMTYLHRMGRAGRYGSTGNCINLALVGPECKLLQNILGIIGGQTLSIPILDDSLNVESTVISGENLLLAEVPDNFAEFEKCKTEVIEMKKKAAKNSKKNTKIKDSKNNSTNVLISGDEHIVKKMLEEKLADIDISSVLGQLASGTLEIGTSVSLGNDNTNAEIHDGFHELLPPLSSKLNLLDGESQNISKENNYLNLDPISILQQLSQEDKVSEFIEEKSDDKKRKRSEHSPTGQREQIKEPSKDTLFCKNKALFSVAKTLSNVETCGEDAGYLTEYLDLLKSKERSETIDVLKKTEEEKDSTKKFNIDRQKNYKDFLENIFLAAYKCQVTDSPDRWQEHLPEKEIIKLEDSYVAAKVEDCNELEEESYDEYGAENYGEEDYDEDYDFQMEKEIEVNLGAESLEDGSQDLSDYSFMKWIPVEPPNAHQNCSKKISLDKKKLVSENSFSIQSSKKPDICNSPTAAVAVTNDISYYHEQFSQYYQHCCSSLWQTGLSFDTVQSFDEWFCYDWQNQVASVRNFVQKKIYLEEMRRFQQE